MKRILFILFLLLILIRGYSATCTSVTGNWNNSGTWSCGHVPTCGDDIVIAAGTTVTVNIQVDLTACGAINIQVDGVLSFENGKKISLSPGSTIVVSSTGSILPGGGGGTSNLITIGSVDVWSSGYGPATGPVTITETNPLPIELISFTAKPLNKSALLEWSTASEINNDFFTIEKSKNAVDYEIVSIVKGAGNSISKLNYHIVDDNPYSTTYYRLKQTDYNGDYTYSKIISICLENGDFSFEVFPNPSNGENITAKINATKGQEILVMVNDLFGKESYSKVIIVEDDGNTVYEIDVAQKLSSGIYIITATSNKKTYNKKLVVK